MRRALRYPVGVHDQFYFLHIPKTGGTTLFEILTRYFALEEILSFEQPSIQDKSMRDQIRSARLIRAHMGYEFYQYVPRLPIFLTMLRDPVTRVISNYAAARRPAQNRPIYTGTLEDFVDTPSRMNVQTHYIAGRQHHLTDAAPETLLSVAKAHLRSFPFFGITERFDDSLRLMVYLMGWEYPASYKPRNTSQSKEKPAETAELREKILHRNPLDLELYNFAQALFEERYQMMLAELN